MDSNDTRFWVFLLVLCFLFVGEPDVWDRLHDKAMSLETCK
jgi:hypothetical protein